MTGWLTGWLAGWGVPKAVRWLDILDNTGICLWNTVSIQVCSLIIVSKQRVRETSVKRKNNGNELIIQQSSPIRFHHLVDRLYAFVNRREDRSVFETPTPCFIRDGMSLMSTSNHQAVSSIHPLDSCGTPQKLPKEVFRVCRMP